MTKCLLLMYLTPLLVDAACRPSLDEGTQSGRSQRCVEAVSSAVSLRDRPAKEIGLVQPNQRCQGSNFEYVRDCAAQEGRPVQRCQGCKGSVSNTVSFRDRPAQEINSVHSCHHCTGALSNSVILNYRPAQTMRLTKPCQRCTGAVSNVVRLSTHPASQLPNESFDAFGSGLTTLKEVPNVPDLVTKFPLPLYDLENENKPYLSHFLNPLQSNKRPGKLSYGSGKFPFPIYNTRSDPSQNTNFPLPPPAPGLYVDEDPCADPQSPLCAFSQGRIFSRPSATSQLTHIQRNPSAGEPFRTESVGLLSPEGAVLNYNRLPLEQVHPKHGHSASYLNEAAAAHTVQATISPQIEEEEEEEYNLERLCNDPFHSFLCKPITKQRQRLTGMLRPQAVLPSNIVNAAGSVQLSERLRPDQRSRSYGPVLSDSLVTGSHRQIAETSTPNYDIVSEPSNSHHNVVKPKHEQLPMYDYKIAPQLAVHVNKYNVDTGFLNINHSLKVQYQSTPHSIHTEPTNNFLFTIKPNTQIAPNNIQNNKESIQPAAAIQSEAVVQVPKDDNDNLERLCNDPFHSFLCKPITKLRQRFTGKLRTNAQIPPWLRSAEVSATSLFKDRHAGMNTKTIQPVPHGAASPPFLATANYGDSFLSPNPSNVVKSILPPSVHGLPSYQDLTPSEERQFIVPTSTINLAKYFYAKPPIDRQFLLPPTFTQTSQAEKSVSFSGPTRPLAAESTYLNPNGIIPPSVPEPPTALYGKLSTPPNVEASPAHHIAAVSSPTIDQEDNLERLCNDSFHSFLCKPVTKPRQRITGKLRATASVLAAVYAGQSSIQRVEGVGKEHAVTTSSSTESSLRSKPVTGFDSRQTSDHLGFTAPIVSEFSPVGRQYTFNNGATLVVPSPSMIESAKIRPSGGYIYPKPLQAFPIPSTEIPLTKKHNFIPQTTVDSATVVFPPNDFRTSRDQNENAQTSSSTQEELAGISGYSYQKPNIIDRLDIRIAN